MSKADAHKPDHDRIDPERERGKGAFDPSPVFSGQGYHRESEERMGQAGPSGQVDASTEMTPPAEHGRDLPPEVGHRAWADPKTGEVHGSGAGDGGGNDGEDYDSGSEGGSGYPATGGEGSASRSGGGDLGPKSKVAGPTRVPLPKAAG